MWEKVWREESCFLQLVDGKRKETEGSRLGVRALLVICVGLSKQKADGEDQVSYYGEWGLQTKKEEEQVLNRW